MKKLAPLFMLFAIISLPNLATATSYLCADQVGYSADVEFESAEPQLLFEQSDMTVYCVAEDTTSNDVLQLVSQKKRSRGYRHGGLCWGWFCGNCGKKPTIMMWQRCR